MVDGYFAQRRVRKAPKISYELAVDIGHEISSDPYYIDNIGLLNSYDAIPLDILKPQSKHGLSFLRLGIHRQIAIMELHDLS